MAAATVQPADTAAPSTVQPIETVSQVFVVTAHTLTGNVYRFHFGPYPSVGELKARLEAHNGHVPANTTVLLRGGGVLADDDVLADGAEVNLIFRYT